MAIPQYEIKSSKEKKPIPYYSAIEKNDIMPLPATGMDLEKDKYHITYMWNLKQSTNEHMHKTETDPKIQRKDWRLPRGYRGGKDGEFGVIRCKLLYIGWIDNKSLLYSTGDYIQYRDKP